MGRNSGLRAVAAVVFAAAVAGPFGAAGPASADPAGLVVEAETSLSSSADKTIKADCPAGKVVTGGGGYLTTSPDVEGHVALDRLEPAADGSGFTATMREVVDTPDPWRLTALAVCVPAPAGRQVVSATGLNQDDLVTTPSCGTKSVIGMGGRINGGSGEVVLDDIQPSFDLKTVTVRGFPVPGGSDNSWTITAYAVCANTPPGLERVAFNTPSSSASEQTAVQGCPAGKALYGAGAAIGNGNGSVLLTGVNIAPQDTARAWAHEIVGGYGNNWTITAYGICGS
jgi:hypothetical protein